MSFDSLNIRVCDEIDKVNSNKFLADLIPVAECVDDILGVKIVTSCAIFEALLEDKLANGEVVIQSVNPGRLTLVFTFHLLHCLASCLERLGASVYLIPCIPKARKFDFIKVWH